MLLPQKGWSCWKPNVFICTTAISHLLHTRNMDNRVVRYDIMIYYDGQDATTECHDIYVGFDYMYYISITRVNYIIVTSFRKWHEFTWHWLRVLRDAVAQMRSEVAQDRCRFVFTRQLVFFQMFLSFCLMFKSQEMNPFLHLAWHTEVYVTIKIYSYTMYNIHMIIYDSFFGTWFGSEFQLVFTCLWRVAIKAFAGSLGTQPQLRHWTADIFKLGNHSWTHQSSDGCMV